MKYLIMALLSMFVLSVMLKVRLRFVWAFMFAAVLFAMFGCATVEPASPGTPSTGDICSHDGTYQLLHCRGKNP